MYYSELIKNPCYKNETYLNLNLGSKFYTMASLYLFDDNHQLQEFLSQIAEEKVADKNWEFTELPIYVSESSQNFFNTSLASKVWNYYPIEYARIIKGLDYLLSSRLDSINLSIGPAVGENLAQDDPLVYAIEQCFKKGIIIVVAAGNSGPQNDTMQPLAKIPGTISVGAVDNHKVLLPLSSRGPEGGFGPTLVSYGRPIIEYIKEGWQTPIPTTSYATPRITRVATLTLKVMQLLWTSYQKIGSNSWDEYTTPLPISRIGFADTGIDPKARSPLPDRVAMHLQSKGDFVSFKTNEHHRKWFRRVYETFHTCPMVGVTSLTLLLALKYMAKPLPKYKSHEVGAGFLSLTECVKYLESITPTRFIQLFSPGEQGNKLATQNIKLDEQLGPLWDKDEVSAILDFFYYGSLTHIVRVIRG